MAFPEAPDAGTPPPPSAEALRRARLMWRQAQDDLKAAARRRKSQAHLECGYLSLQAAINALTVVCYLHGQFRPPNFSAARMAFLCQTLDPRFAALADACTVLEQVQSYSPFGVPAAPEALTQASQAGLEAGTAVVGAVRDYLREHRRRFFAP